MINRLKYINCKNTNCSHYKDCCKIPTEIHYSGDNLQLMIVGQGAGKDEEREKRPWIGKAGQLFRSIYREIAGNNISIVMSNTVRCRPTDSYGKDREPYHNEIENCIRFLYDDIKEFKPAVLLLMGSSSAKCFGYSGSVKKMRVKSLVERTIIGIHVYTMVTYHPAGILPGRNPQNRKHLVKDIENAMKISRSKMTNKVDQLNLFGEL